MFRFIVILALLFILNPVWAVQRGGVQYSVPTDYSRINETQLSAEADRLFKQYFSSVDEAQKEKLLYSILSDYAILGEIDRENPLYFARLGIVYGKLKKDRYAKANFFRCTNINGKYPYGFYWFGNFYFERQNYRKALGEYLKAYKCGYNTDYDTLYQIGVIYEKLGDYKYSIKYYKQALLYNDSQELRNKIVKLEELLAANPLYDVRKRLKQDE